MNLDLSDQKLDFSKFIDCDFNSCNLSNVTILETSFQNCYFTETKLIGINFSNVNSFLFAIKCERSDLSFTYFERNDLTKCSFEYCSFREAQMTQVKAGKVPFNYSDLTGVIFDDCELTGASFIEVDSLVLDPQLNRIKNISISRSSLEGLLTELRLNVID
ncbi:MAG: pentapeptide repeat-containing protein [Flavobacteriales bacterium]|nr:pentapeptide repeat-containing protein [Flavobacteriales bacterium]